jgi:hypothetical protein
LNTGNYCDGGLLKFLTCSSILNGPENHMQPKLNNFDQLSLYLINKYVLCYLLQNAKEVLQTLRNPLAVVCNSCSKASWKLQIDFLKPSGNLWTFSGALD